MSAQACPVCAGRGEHPAGFYTPGLAAPGSGAGGTETCRTCGGRGMVIVEGASAPLPPEDPTDLTYRG